MGSGKIAIYSPHGSQMYAESYHVDPEVLIKDKEDHYVYDSKTGYFKNPLAKNLEECINNGQIEMNGKRAFGEYTYVLDMDNMITIIFGKRYNPNKDGWKAPHPTLIGGLNPEVQCAGMIYFYKGRILWFNGNSGHYKPSSKSLLKVEKVLDEFRAVHPEVFHIRYMGAISG